MKPHTLLDAVIKAANLKNDAELSRALLVAPPVISHIRNGRMGIGAVMIIRIHELTGITVKEIKELSKNED